MKGAVLTVKVTDVYYCSLERAFKTPMLCDITKVHTGFGPMPKATHSTNDEHWGKPGYSKKVFFEKGIVNDDKVVERIENTYWKLEVTGFKPWMLGFTKFVGLWKTTELEPNRILVEYSYSLHSSIGILYPLHWLFAKTFWRVYMRQVLRNIKKLAYHNEPYLYD